MVIDTSAIIAIFEQETGCEKLQEILGSSKFLCISAATVLETYMVIFRRRGEEGWQDVREFFEIYQIETVPLSSFELEYAMDGFRRYGKGGGSGVKLNYGDCFSYGLAKALDEPLLFVGDDFAKTDVKTVNF